MDALKQDLSQLYDEIWDNIKYNALGLLSKLNSDKSGQTIAKELILSAPGGGFQAICDLNRPDLTVEARVVENPEWRRLLGREVVEVANWKLEQVDYAFYTIKPN